MKKKDEKQAILVNASILKMKDMKQVDKDKIADLRIAYESLTSEQKELVKNINLLERYEKQVKISSISNDDLGLIKIVVCQIDISYDTIMKKTIDLSIKRECIKYTVLLYESIDNLKEYVSNNQKIIEMEIQLEKLERIKYNQDLAFEIVEQINQLPDVITISCEEEVLEVKENYDELIEEAKEYVTNYRKLELAINAIRDIKNAMVVVEQINSLSTHVSLSDEADIMEVNEAYYALSVEERQYVTNHSKLEEINNALKELIQAQLDKKTALNMDNQLQLLYELVSDEEILLTTKHEEYNRVISLYKEYNQCQIDYMEKGYLIKEIEELLLVLDKENERISKAMDIYNKINNLPFYIEISDHEMLEMLNERYNTLDDDLKKYITNIEVLENAICLCDSKMEANRVSLLIDTLDSSYSTNNLNSIKKQYDEMSVDAKSFVNNYAKLASYLKNNQFYDLQLNKALKLNKEIKGFKVSNIDDEAKILWYQSVYDSLPSNVKDYVDMENFEVEAAKLGSIKEASIIEEKIELLPKEVNLDHQYIIYDIFNEFEGKSNTVKGYVTNKNTLIIAKQKIDSFKEAIKIIEDGIKQIGSVEKDEGDDIARVRMNYELLDNNMKCYVSNYEDLVNMERNFIKLEKTFIEEVKSNAIKTYIDEQILLLNEIVSDNAIPVLKKREFLEAIKKSYEGLEDKTLVKNYNIIIELEKQI